MRPIIYLIKILYFINDLITFNIAFNHNNCEIFSKYENLNKVISSIDYQNTPILGLSFTFKKVPEVYPAGNQRNPIGWFRGDWKLMNTDFSRKIKTPDWCICSNGVKTHYFFFVTKSLYIIECSPRTLNFLSKRRQQKIRGIGSTRLTREFRSKKRRIV